jgi:hypothetical protein
MKSDIRARVLSALAAAAKRPRVTTEPKRIPLRFRFTTTQLLLLLGLKLVFSFYTSQAL